LILKVAVPAGFNEEIPRLWFPSRNVICPVGTPDDELMFAVNVIVEPGTADVVASSVTVVTNPVTCRDVLSLTGKNTRSPLYCAVMA
jgi:hypothetical protein